MSSSSSSSSNSCIQPDSNYKITSGRNRKRFCLIKHLTNHYLPYEDYDSVQAHRLLQECTPGSYLIRKVIHRYPNDDRVYVSYVVCVRESNWYPHAVTQTLIKNCGNHFKFMSKCTRTDKCEYFLRLKLFTRKKVAHACIYELEKVA